VGGEAHQPYDRPPLSKQVLAGTRTPEDARLDVQDVGAEWRLGIRVTALDVAGRTVTLSDGDVLPYDGIVLATGAVPRRIPGWPEQLAGLHVLRSLDDCLALRADLVAGPRRVVVIGAGFIGCEVAATARALGLEVTVVEPLPAPCIRGIGEEMGTVVAAVHRDHGVDLRLGAMVDDLLGDDRVEGVRLAGGATVAADVVVVGIGVAPETGWLHGSGLTLEDGVVCDATCAAAPGVVAAGDVARWPHPRYGTIRVEHWDNAIEQGEHAARTLLAHLAGGEGEPFAPVPWFWSDQFDRKLQVAGRAMAGSVVEVVDGSVDDRRFAATYTLDGEVVAVLGMNMPAAIARWRNELAAAKNA
jgi:NADPH-dependent 2,4-dienoyl-CoA reductase/sulfur reductase-like enzyme